MLQVGSVQGYGLNFEARAGGWHYTVLGVPERPYQ